MRSPSPPPLAGPTDVPAPAPPTVPQPPAPLPSPEDPADATLARLMARMQRQADFPALSARVQALQRMASSEREPLQRLADEILQDVGLTQKLLRLVNSALFRGEGQAVATVTRAVALVGLSGLRDLALSLMLVEHMADRAHAQRLKHAFARALLAGQVAQTLALTRRESEEAFLAALFQNLGALIAEFYFPQESQHVHAKLAEAHAATLAAGRGGHTPADPNDILLANRLAQQVLGLDYDHLGTAVAQHWGLPDSLRQAMRHPAGAGPARRLLPGPELLRWLAVASNEAAAVLWTADPRRAPELLTQVAHRHGRALAMDADELRGAADTAWQALVQMAPTLGLSLPRATAESPAAGAQALAAGEVQPRTAASAAPPASAEPGLAPAADGPGAAPEPGNVWADGASRDPAVVDGSAVRTALALLSAGIQDVAAALAAEQPSLHQVMQMVLETIYRALRCRRVVFCLREPDGSRLVGRLALGHGRAGSAGADVGPRQVVVLLRPPPGQAPDRLAAACLAGEDCWAAPFSATHPPAPGGAWPDWLRQAAPGACFGLSLRLRGQPLGLIYAEHDEPAGWDEAERALLRTLRSQALLAFRPPQ